MPVLLLAVSSALACTFAGCSRAGSKSDPLLLHQRALVIDTHSDTTPWFQDPEWRFDEEHQDGHVDLPRIERGGLDAQFWSIYLGRTEGEGLAIRGALERIDAVYEMAARYPERTEIVTTTAGLRSAVARGKLASLMGLEGGHLIEESLPALRSFYRLGVRYMTLTHSFHIGWADSSGTREPLEPLHGGLTDFGREVVLEMNRLGMMVDVSHVSDGSFWDTLATSRAPVIASHSSCRAVGDHPRNLSDDMLRGLAQNGGVVMINFYPVYLDPARTAAAARDAWSVLRPRFEWLRRRYPDDPIAVRRAIRPLLREHPFPTTPLGVVLDHFDHALRVAGPDHVGIGADWDGVFSMPDGMRDVSQLPALTAGLLKRGHPPETVLKVLGGNLLRVMREVERTAERSSRREP
jgi:membrane dipeptidase